MFFFCRQRDLKVLLAFRSLKKGTLTDVRIECCGAGRQMVGTRAFLKAEVTPIPPGGGARPQDWAY